MNFRSLIAFCRFAPVLFLFGCVSLVPSRSAWFKAPLEKGIAVHLGEIAVDSLYSTSCDPVELRDTALVLARNSGIDLRDSPAESLPDDTLLMDIYLYENKFNKGLNTYNSVTVTMTVYRKAEGRGNPAGKTIYTRESGSTFNSFQFLYGVMTKAFKHFAAASR